jgi:hypothetical protein
LPFTEDFGFSLSGSQKYGRTDKCNSKSTQSEHENTKKYGTLSMAVGLKEFRIMA